MAFFVSSDGTCLRPASKAAAIEMEKLAKGVPLKVEPKQPRNGKFHRMAFAFFSYVADALNDGPTNREWTAEEVLTHVKIATGHVETVRLGKTLRERLGEEFAVVPKSISFSAMDEAEFGRFMDAAFIYVRDELCRWICDSEHWAEIEAILRSSGLGEAA